jgi:acetyl esterase/lipase
MNSARMSTTPVDVAIERVRGVYGRWRRDTPISEMRADWDRLFPAPAQDVVLRAESAAGVEVLWVIAPPTAPGEHVPPREAVSRDSMPQRVLLYFHGGGYKLGSVTSHRDVMARIGAASHCKVLGVNYRLAPEAHFPAPVHDALAVYEWLIAAGVPPAQIAVGGDSAGGGLAAALLLTLRDLGRAMPAAAVLLSAWTDLTAQGESYTTRAEADPIHQRAMILATARQYLGPDGDAANPLASPLFGDLAGLPPLLLQVGDRETGLDDSTRFAAKARAAGVRADLEVYADMIHVFQQFAAEIPQARLAIAAIGRFLLGIWGEPTAEGMRPC